VNFDQLKIFISVVEYCSFTKAAESMYISHSTTSRSVAALEETLGVKLLERDSRSVKTTAAGDLLYREGQLLLKKSEELEEALKNAGNGLSGRLTVASPSLYCEALASCYKAFCSRYPEAILGMYHRELSEIFGQVSGGEADFGVTFSYIIPDDFENFEMRTVAHEKFCVITSADHPLAGRTHVKASDLISENYVSVGEQRSGFMRKIEEAFLKDRPKYEMLSVPTLESLFLQVRSGNGISLVPYPMAREYGANCAILDVQDVDSGFDIVVFWRKNNENPALKLFCALIDNKLSAETAF